ncbi:MAG: helix-turn-helix domain-containing protein [Bacteroidota bacterium]
MQKPTVILLQFGIEELRSLIDEAVNAVLAKNSAFGKEEEILTRKQVAELLGISFTTINSWCRDGRLKRHYMGAKVYFLKSEVIALLKKN